MMMILLLLLLLLPPLPLLLLITITTLITATNTARTTAGAGVCRRPMVGTLWHSEESQHMDQLILGDLTARNSSLAQPQVEGPTLLLWRGAVASVGCHWGVG